MVCVDYGCGGLRVGQHFIRHLDPGKYIGLDVVDRFYRDGLTLLGPELVAVKRPYLAAIEPHALIGSSAWAHSFASLAAALGRVDASLIVWPEPRPDSDGGGHEQAMLIVARTPDRLARWSAGPA